MNAQQLVYTLLLLVENHFTQETLITMLSPNFKLVSGKDGKALDQVFDLCIVDGKILTSLEQQILTRKNDDTPFLPFLLITSRDDLPKLANHIKYTVDEILLQPINDLILQPRVETLLNTRRLVKEIQLLADFDELTGALTRRHFFKMSEREFLRGRRFGRPLSIVMLDIDFFKTVNDTYGHAVGDQVLREVVQRCQKNIREIDIFGRYGGEEFALVLPEMDREEAQDIAERLRTAIARCPFQTKAGNLEITISLGLADLNQDESIDAILKRADEALYFAKRSGRNQVKICKAIDE